MSVYKTSNNHSKNEADKEVRQCKIETVASPWLTKNQARAYLQIDIHELNALINSGKIRSVRRGKRSVFVKAEWLDNWMESLPSGAKIPSALIA